MKKLALLSIVTVAVFTSGLQAKKMESKRIAFCNQWKHEVRVGFTKNPDDLITVQGGQCEHLVNQEKGQFTYVVVNGMLHTLQRSFPNKRIVGANAHKAVRGKVKNITVRYTGNEHDVYNWDPASKMFIREQ